MESVMGNVCEGEGGICDGECLWRLESMVANVCEGEAVLYYGECL